MGPEIIIAGWFVSAVASKIAGVLGDIVISEQPAWLLGMKDELERLKIVFPRIKAVVDATERMQIPDGDSPLGQWLWQLKHALEQADDVLDELKYLALKQQKRGTVSNLKDAFAKVLQGLFRNDSTLKRLKDAIKNLDLVAGDVRTFFKLAKVSQQQQQPVTINSNITSSFLPFEEEVFCREEQMEQLVEKLTDRSYEFSNQQNIAILPITGHGGMGKTVLARHVYHHERIKEYFTLRIWVCVSHNGFDVLEITKNILECGFHKRVKLASLEAIQGLLIQKMSFHKFLLVLDDVWNDNDRDSWEKLLTSLRFGRKGSKILFTTRLGSTIYKMMPCMLKPIVLQGLESTRLWTLLKKCAFLTNNHANYTDLEEIGGNIAKNLRGCPLAAKTVGGVLRAQLDSNHWRSVLDCDMLHMDHIHQGRDDIWTILELSYHHLPPHLRPCFAFCSIFPKDHQYQKNELACMWIAAGFVQQPEDNNNIKWEDVAKKYFADLTGRNFFDKHLDGGGNETFTMHDLLNELARHVSRIECSHFSGNLPPKIPPTVRHLWIKAGNNGSVVNELSKLKHLRTLFLSSDYCSISVVEDLLKTAQNLRIVSLKLHCVADGRDLPEAIGKLIHLRFLGLHTNSRLPDSYCKLYHLQFLNIRSSIQEYKVPKKFTQSINLRDLKVAPDGSTTSAG